MFRSLRAALPETDLLFFESATDSVVRRLISIQPDVVLIDDAPGLGQQALAQVVEAAPGVPCLVLCSRRDPETLASFTLADARQCVSKPFSCDQLRSAVARVTATAPASARPAAVDTDVQPSSSALNQHQMALRWLGRTMGHMQNPVPDQSEPCGCHGRYIRLRSKRGVVGAAWTGAGSSRATALRKVSHPRFG